MDKLIFRFLIFVVVLLASRSVIAEDFVILDSIRVAVNRQLDLPDAGDSEHPLTRTGTAINRAIIRVSKDFNAVPKLDTVFLTVDSTGAALNTDFQNIAGVMRVAGKDLWFPLIPLPVDSLRTPLENSDVGDKLPHFFVHNKRLFTQPKFAGESGKTIDTLQIEYFGIGGKLTSGADTTNVLTQYREAVIVYASYIISEDPIYLQWYTTLVSLDRGSGE